MRRISDIFPYMSLSWRKHFERVEFVGATNEVSNHIWVTERWNAPQVDLDPPVADGNKYLLLPHQPLAVNGWADKVASRIFLAAFNSYGEENWASESNKLAIVVSPHDAAWSAEEIRRRVASCRNVGAIALPLGPSLLGSFALHPIYEAAIEVGLPTPDPLLRGGRTLPRFPATVRKPPPQRVLPAHADAAPRRVQPHQPGVRGGSVGVPEPEAHLLRVRIHLAASAHVADGSGVALVPA